MTKKLTRWLLCVVLVLALAASFALTACEETEQATATFVGGDGATGTAPDAITVNVGETITLPHNNFQRSGYTFVGWSDGSTTYDEDDEYTLNSNTTFTAQWESNSQTSPEQYTLSFDLGAHAAADAQNPDSLQLEEGKTTQLPSAPKAAEGWTFDGWGTDKLAAKSTYTMPAQNVKLTAQWKAVSTEPFTTVPFDGIFGLSSSDDKELTILFSSNTSGRLMTESGGDREFDYTVADGKISLTWGGRIPRRS